MSSWNSFNENDAFSSEIHNSAVPRVPLYKIEEKKAWRYSKRMKYSTCVSFRMPHNKRDTEQCRFQILLPTRSHCLLSIPFYYSLSLSRLISHHSCNKHTNTLQHTHTQSTVNYLNVFNTQISFDGIHEAWIELGKHRKFTFDWHSTEVESIIWLTFLLLSSYAPNIWIGIFRQCSVISKMFRFYLVIIIIIFDFHSFPITRHDIQSQ